MPRAKKVTEAKRITFEQYFAMFPLAHGGREA
jgi:hypothetical protein